MSKRDQQIKQDLDQIDQMQDGTSDFEENTVFHPWQTFVGKLTLETENNYYCGLCGCFMPLSHFPH